MLMSCPSDSARGSPTFSLEDAIIRHMLNEATNIVHLNNTTAVLYTPWLHRFAVLDPVRHVGVGVLGIRCKHILILYVEIKRFCLAVVESVKALKLGQDNSIQKMIME